jgi:hypothetical protein
VVNGFNYRTAYGSPSTGTIYTVVVYIQPWTNTTEIKSFKSSAIGPVPTATTAQSTQTTTSTSQSPSTSSVPPNTWVSTSQAVQPQVVGGYQELADYEKDPEWQKADQLARSENPNLANATVLRVTRQVVSGSNYRTVYQSGWNQYDVTVYSQPWTNTLRVTQTL